MATAAPTSSARRTPTPMATAAACNGCSARRLNTVTVKTTMARTIVIRTVATRSAAVQTVDRRAAGEGGKDLRSASAAGLQSFPLPPGRREAEMTNTSKPTEQPLESWKEIASFLHRDVRTVRRWEKSEGLPVHRHLHQSKSSVYAYASEL